MTGHRFSLVELLVVLAVLAALAGVALVSLGSVRRDAQEKAAAASLRRIQSAVTGAEGYLEDLDYVERLDLAPPLPALRELSVRALLQKPGWAPEFDPLTKRGWRGPYLQPQGAAVGLAALDASFAAYLSEGEPAQLDPWRRPIVVQRPTGGADEDERDRYTRLVSAGPNGEIDADPAQLTPADVRADANTADDVVLFLIAE